MNEEDIHITLYNKLVELGFKPPTHNGDFQNTATELNEFFQRVVVPTMNSRFPKGSWYLVTVTTPSGSTKNDLFQVHNKFIDYMAGKGTVQHGVIEKSSIWHCHYMVNLQQAYAKNLQRDLRKACGVIVDVARKVSSAKKFNGLCKYIIKREYEQEKASTHVATIVDGVTYSEGKGYILSPNPTHTDFFTTHPPPPHSGQRIYNSNEILKPELTNAQ